MRAMVIVFFALLACRDEGSSSAKDGVPSSRAKPAPTSQNGTGSNGAGSNGAGSNGAGSNGAGSNGAGSNGAYGAGSNGANGSNGASSNGATSNGQAGASTSSDPWAPKPANPDDPPSLAERHKLAETACPTVAAPYFYRVEKAGKTSHILGTRHVSVPLAKFPKPVHDAIASASLAVFEVAPDDDSDEKPKKVSLPDALGPDLWTRYRKLVGTEVADGLAHAAPSQAMILMIVMYEDVGSMLDMEIERTVQAAHIPTAGLESSVFQDRLLNKLLDLRMLKATVEHTKDRAEIEDESRKDLSEYCAGTDDTPGMDADMRKDLEESGYTRKEIDNIDEQMVFKRNASWIPKLEKLFQQDKVFVAVGADHLSGPRGVVALLQKRGFKVTRVTK